MTANDNQKNRVAGYIETLRKRLVDLTGRNRLISFRPQTRSSIELLAPDIPAIWRRLVDEEKSLRLVAGLIPLEGEKPKFKEWPAKECIKAVSSGRLAVKLPQKRLGSHANYIRRHAVEIIDETGTNHLYLALGFLKWFESEDSKVGRMSPLLLVPVTLAEVKAKGQEQERSYTISYDGSELNENLSLKLRFEEDFGINLPSLGDEVDPDQYLEDVADLISRKSGWEVVNEAHLAFFSFSKLRMYRDLDPDIWPKGDSIVDHDLIRRLLDGSERSGEEPAYGSVEVHDGNDEALEIPIVCEADSSQHTAILKVCEGKNTVIEGPPGTGKSQTITNIIATAIAAGKTVLFVAEKKAALDVVYSNLQQCGLQDFCLELHASKSNKRQILDSIRRRRGRTFSVPSSFGKLKREWKDILGRLGRYVESVSGSSGPWDEALFDSLSRSIAYRTEGIPSYRTTFKGRSPNGDQLLGRVEFLREFSNHLHNPEVFRDHPWSGFEPVAACPGDEEEICGLFADILSHVRNLKMLGEDLDARVGGTESLPKYLAEEVSKSLPVDFLASGEKVDGESLVAFRNEGVFEAVNVILEARDLYRKEVALASEVLSPRCVSDPIRVGFLEKAMETFLRLGLEKHSIENLLQRIPYIEESAGIFGKLAEIIDKVRSLEFDCGEALGHLRRNEKILELAANPPVGVSEFVCEELFFAGALESIKVVRKECDTLAAEERALQTKFVVDDAPGDAELGEHRKVLRATGGGLLSWFNRDYREAKQAVRGYLISQREFSFPEIIDDLDRLQKWRFERDKFNGNRFHRERLGLGFRGMGTQWDRLLEIAEWSQKLAGHGVLHKTGAGWGSEANQKELRDLWHQWRAVFDRLAAVEEIAGDVIRASFEVELIDEVGVRDAPAFMKKWSAWYGEVLSQTRDAVLDPKVSVSKVQEAVKVAESAQGHLDRVESDAGFRQVFGALANGLDSNWERINETVAWVGAVRRFRAPGSLKNWLLAPDFSERRDFILETLRRAGVETNAITALFNKIESYGTIDPRWLFGDESESWTAAVERFERLISFGKLMAQWINHATLIRKADEHGVTLFIENAIRGDFPVSALADVYSHTVVEQHGFKIIRKEDHLSTFSHQVFEASRKDFAKKDRTLLESNRAFVATRAAGRKSPAGNGVGSVKTWTEGALLANEIGKQTRHIPIRQLMLRSSRAIRALKPCLMMSPLSVAQYLDPSLPKFDLVVMDEASQIRPEDALGAVARAKQLVVVGDTKQMPPSDLWQKQIDEDGDEDEDVSAAADAESVLENALHSFQPVYRLKWHYRSLHEDLIKFSNFHYYDNELVIFPAARAKDGRLGIRFHYLEEGRFQSGARVNVVEAEVVARAAVEHLKNHPEKSLMVATMNRKQQEAVEDLIESICDGDAIAREAVETARNHDFEKFLVRNLENIQGDQRDVVFISFTYGKDPASGRPMQRFGPINGKSGRRRLNVLFSRAKERIEAFSSLLASDVVGKPGVADGVNDLKNYLKFAQDGILYEEGVNTGRDPDSGFEISVMKVVRSMGLVAVPQVGVASYRVDIGICLPGEEGRYLLGIECDGASYHSSRWARDRDRIREEVLRSRGWDIYRVWSTDWFRQHEDAKERLMDRLRRVVESERKA